MIGMLGLTSVPAEATTTTVDNPCGVQGWYVNPDETADAPTRSTAGFFFDNKDLIHHATPPIDLPDIKTNTLSFVADNAGKVVGKMETENPYSTIVQQADGMFWSTAMTYDQIGGQGHPVDKVSDLVGTDEDPRPTKPGKAEYGTTTHVVSFGVGYWVADGSTTVSSIKFHGYNYDLTCKTPTTSPTSTKPSPTVTATSNPAGGLHHPIPGKTTVRSASASGPALAITGPSTTVLVVVAGFIILGGVMLYVVTRRRKNRFVP
jgi:LPXTG-motif cell wall-anchored protein